MSSSKVALVSLLVAVAVAGWTAAPALAHYPESTTQTLGPSSMGSVTGSDIPPNTTQATFTVQPDPADVAAFDEAIATAMSAVPNLKNLKKSNQRVVVCAMMANNVASLGEGGDGTIPPEFFVLAANAMLADCMHLAFKLSAAERQAQAALGGGVQVPGGVRSPAAAGPCMNTPRAIPIRITRVGKRWKKQVTGPSTTPRGRTPLLVTCKRQGAGLVITMRPRKKGVKLRQLIGSRPGVAYANSGTTRLKLTTTISVR